MSPFQALGMAFLLATAGCAAGPAPIPATARTPLPAPGALEREIHSLVNQHRTRIRLPVLGYDDRIAEVAREHSRAMALAERSFGHDGFDARAASVRRISPSTAMAENVAYSSRTGLELPHSLVQGWISSPGHRKNIEGAFQLTGVGVARARDGTSYVTQIFVRRE